MLLAGYEVRPPNSPDEQFADVLAARHCLLVYVVEEMRDRH